MEVEIKQIAFGSMEYELEVLLRSKILREPLGLVFSREELNRESDDIHIAAFAETKLIGCLILSPQPEKRMKMRQFAVDSKAQGLGIGKKLVAYSEALSKEMGFLEIDLHARQTAVSFYLTLGYETYGDPFEEVTLPHRKMKRLI